MGQLKTFKGGVHPIDGKAQTASCSIETFQTPKVLTVPLSQHIGAPALAVVKKGDKVYRGTQIGSAGGFVSAPVHSPVSGTVKELGTCLNALGKNVQSVVIESDGEDKWAEGCNIERDPFTLDGDAIRTAIAENGIVGMGGATFPCHVKLSPPKGMELDTLIINGVECEPYLTSDHRLMLERGEGVIEGTRLLMRAIGVNRALIGVENNKPDAIKALSELVKEIPSVEVVPLEVKYPQGAEKQLISALVGREVPSGGLPAAVGCVVQNVATAFAIHEALRYSRPLIERVCTVTGPGITRPGNFLIRVGTDSELLLKHCGVMSGVNKIIAGGPMMGLAQKTTSFPLAKGSGGLLLFHDETHTSSTACIRCGRCVDSCPAQLVPCTLSILAERDMLSEMQENDVLDCIECGVCSYVCPSRRPIVHQIRLGKYEAMRARAEAEAKRKAEEEKIVEE